MKYFIAFLLFFYQLCEGHAQETKSPDTQADQVYAYCFNPRSSMAEGRGCLYDQEVRIRRQLDAAIRKKRFDISEIGKKTEDDGRPYGSEAAKKLLASFAAEQSAWENYSKKLCQNGLDAGSGTAGAEDDAALCRIRAAFRRIKDLR